MKKFQKIDKGEKLCSIYFLPKASGSSYFDHSPQLKNKKSYKKTFAICILLFLPIKAIIETPTEQKKRKLKKKI